MENYVLALFTHSGWKYAEVQALLGHVRRGPPEQDAHLHTRVCPFKIKCAVRWAANRLKCLCYGAKPREPVADGA
jgi:hypothetical protein